MKTKTLIILGLLHIASLLACSGTRFPASNERKAEYLEKQKMEFDEPGAHDEIYDKKSGKGGGHEWERK